MRVLYFYQYFNTPKGSYGGRMYEFARRWVNLGHDVTVVTSVYDKSDLQPDRFLQRYDVDGIDVRVINVRLSNKHGFVHRFLTFALYAAVACWYALRLPADVVVSSSGPLTVGLPGLAARWLRRKPLVFEVRDLWPEGAIQLGILTNPALIAVARWFEKLCYRSATAIVALSEGMAEGVRRRYSRALVTVVPNASDNELFEQGRSSLHLPEWAEGKRIVIYAGALGIIDDVGQVVEMARLLQHRPDVVVVIAGDGRQRSELEARAQQLGLANVHFLGLRPRVEVMGWLAHSACALFVCKNSRFIDAASPNKLFDAFAAGLPVVQVSQGWIKDLFARESCGITVPQDDPEALSGAVLRILDDALLARSYATNAKRLAMEQFDRTLLAERLLGVLAAAAGKPVTPTKDARSKARWAY
jgi:glycosyltransferase involved in cell wall biosynthesis